MRAAHKQFTAIALDHAPRGMIVLVAEDDEAVEAFLCRDQQQQFKGGGHVAVALFPRHDGVSHMSRYFGRQFLGAGLKTQADAAAEFAVPYLEQTGDQLRRSDPAAPLVTSNEAVEEPRSVLA